MNPFSIVAAGMLCFMLLDSSTEAAGARKDAPIADKPAHDEKPPLHAAVANQDMAAVEKLLARGVPVNQADAAGLTPLHVAAMHGSKAMVKLLLDRKADVDAHTRILFLAGLQAGSHTPLHLAIATNQPEVVALLCDRGANLDDRSFPFDRMLNHVLYRGQGELVEVLLVKRGKNQWPALLKRAQNGPDLRHNPNLVLEAFVRLGVDVAAAVPDPAIVWAMAHGYRKLALQFIDGGADRRAGQPLARAAERGYDDIVARLLEEKVDADDTGAFKTTPLQFAVFKGHVKCVELLLKHGADTKRISPATRAAMGKSTDVNQQRIIELLERREAGM